MERFARRAGLHRLLRARPAPPPAAEADASPTIEGERSARARVKAENRRRAAFLEDARGLMPYVSVAVGDDVFFVPTTDHRIGTRLFVRSGSKDMLVLERALRHLHELGRAPAVGSVFVEVGANLGTAVVTALRHHGFAAGVALEPSPATFVALRLNLVANGLDDRVEALQVAVSDSEGEVAFDVSDPNPGAHRVVAPGTTASSAVVVDTVTLDALVERGVIEPARVGLVWIDAAGHEGRVLAGASRLLTAGVPIVTAIKHGWPETEDAVVEALTPHYSEVVELREHDVVRPIADLRRLVDALERSTDVLVVRR